MARRDGARPSIGELARRTGCKVETIRYYERVGLMPEPPRTAGGHRVYGPDDVQRLASIRRCRALGFRIDEVRELLSLVDARSRTCEEAREIGLRHLACVRGKLDELRSLERVLDTLVAGCSGDRIAECAFLDALFEPLAAHGDRHPIHSRPPGS